MNSNIEAVVKSTIVLVLNEYMEKERDEYLKVPHYDHSEDRHDYRNGYYERESMMSINEKFLLKDRSEAVRNCPRERLSRTKENKIRKKVSEREAVTDKRD